MSTVASHWFEAMIRINEIESAKSFFRSEDVKIPSLGHSCRVTSRFLKIKKQAASRNHQRRSLMNCLHCLHGKTNVFSRGGHVAWVIYDYFKVSDTDEVFFYSISMRWPGDGVPKTCLKQADSRTSRICVCANTLRSGGTGGRRVN